MKFVLKHRSDILKILADHGLQETDVSFVKKRGRININHLKSSQSFSYLRKKETILDPHHKQWKHREWYKVKTSGAKEHDVQDWSQVAEAFSQWLSDLLL